MSVIRIFPHPRVEVKKWDIDNYPEVIEVKMSNNTTQKYVRFIEQPEPQCQKAIDIIRAINENTFGGGYYAKHTKK